MEFWIYREETWIKLLSNAFLQEKGKCCFLSKACEACKWWQIHMIVVARAPLQVETNSCTPGSFTIATGRAVSFTSNVARRARVMQSLVVAVIRSDSCTWAT